LTRRNSPDAVAGCNQRTGFSRQPTKRYVARPVPPRPIAFDRLRDRPRPVLSRSPGTIGPRRAASRGRFRMPGIAFRLSLMSPKRLLLSVLEEAANDSAGCHDAYGTVAVMAWPVAVALRRSAHAFAERERALPRSCPHPGHGRRQGPLQAGAAVSPSVAGYDL